MEEGCFWRINRQHREEKLFLFGALLHPNLAFVVDEGCEEWVGEGWAECCRLLFGCDDGLEAIH